MFVGHSSSMLSANRFMYIYQTIEIDPFIFLHMDLEISLGFILQTVSLFLWDLGIFYVGQLWVFFAFLSPNSGDLSTLF